MCLEESFCPFTRDALLTRLRRVTLCSIFLSIIRLSYGSCSPEKLSPLKRRAVKKCLCNFSILVPVCSSVTVLSHAVVQLIKSPSLICSPLCSAHIR